MRWIDQDWAPAGYHAHRLDATGSTNDDARCLALAGAPDRTVVAAYKQTGGRGRRGAAWFATPGEALTFSVILRPAAHPALWPRLALCAGLATATALEHWCTEVGIKWPNDVWIAGRKAAGVLVEAAPGFVVVGIGVNVLTKSFPPELATVATSLAHHIDPTPEPAAVLQEILRQFALRSGQIGGDFSEVIAAANLRCVLRDRQVSLRTAAGPSTGLVVGISPTGELLIRDAAGQLKSHVQADEIRIIS